MVAADGGVFSFVDATYKGWAPECPASGPRSVVAMVASPTGAGYWQAAHSGELLAFGDAAHLGNPSGLSRPVVGMAAVPARLDADAIPVEPTTLTATPTTTTTAPRFFHPAPVLCQCRQPHVGQQRLDGGGREGRPGAGPRRGRRQGLRRRRLPGGGSARQPPPRRP